MFNAASIKQYFNTWGTECFIFPWSPKLGLCLASFAFEACLYCPRAEHILYTFGYRSDAPTINHNSSAPRVCDSDRTADEDAEQIELFVITAYPNTRMPAIIPPAPGMAGGKWNSPLCSVILLDFFPSLLLLTAFIFGVWESSSCTDSRRSCRRGQNKNRKDEVRVKGGTRWGQLTCW